MTAPAARLLAAADLLDKRASEATEGCPLDPCPRWRGEGCTCDSNDRAVMHSEVDKELAEWLRCASRSLAAKLPIYQELVDQRRTTMDGMLGHALNVADLLLAGGS